MLNSIKMIVARSILRSRLNQGIRVFLMCIGVVFGFFYSLFSIVQRPNLPFFICGCVIFVLFFVFIIAEIYWVDELPEEKEKEERERVDKILKDARKILKEFEFIGNDRTKKLRGLMFLCNEGEYSDAVEKLETWILNYKDMTFMKEHLGGLKQTEKTLPTDIKVVEKRVEELCVLIK
ncbi:MAG: hypothetical protein ISR98_01595 [Parcubacteria group bacterium]|nr:hypothetical protein [Parcubacteria group bacterium]